MKKPGFGVIGLGLWGETHLMAYSEHAHADLVKVCDLDEKRAKKMAKQYGVKEYCTDYRELLKDDRIDAVSIVTPDITHTPLVAAAARAGKHILCEKPMATKVADCEKMIAAADKAGVMLMVDFHNRFNPTVAQVKNAIDAGELGELKMGTLRLNDTIAVPRDWLPWAGKSSVLWFIGSHSVDLIRYLFNDEVERVYCVARSDVLKGLGVNTPDFFLSTLELKGGAVVQIENCWIIAETAPVVCDFRAEIVGSKGTCYIDVLRSGAVEKYTAKEASYPDVFCRPQVLGRNMGFGVESIRHFADCVITGKPPLVTARDGIECTRVLCALLESAKKGAPVEVK